MPEAGYGKYPVNLSILVSQETADLIAAIAADEHCSKADVVRSLLDGGLTDPVYDRVRPDRER